MSKKAFIFKDDKSDKFWWIEYSGDDLVINYGKAGTSGKYQIKEFDNKEQCNKEAEKLIAQKIKKGYTEDSSFDFDNHLYFEDEEMGLHPKTSHPNFRTSFIDKRYYSCGDEEAPFGSDEGSDALAFLMEIVRKKNNFDFAAFPKHLIKKQWRMLYIEPGECDEETVKRLIEKNEMDLVQSDMITYATAFGQIKITGRVDKGLKEKAIKAMLRMQVIAKLQAYERSEISEIMIRDLSAFDKYSD